MDAPKNKLSIKIRFALVFLILLPIIFTLVKTESGPSYYSKYWEFRQIAPNVNMYRLYDGVAERIFNTDYDGDYLVLAHRAECFQNSYNISIIANIKRKYDLQLVGVFYSEATFSHQIEVAKFYLSHVIDIIPKNISPYDRVYYDRYHTFKDSYFPISCNFGYIFDMNHKLKAFFKLNDKETDEYLSKYADKL